jgi:hypothetical protein
MPEEAATAVELLESLGNTIQTIADNLKANRLDRKSLQTLLCDYAARASSDGRLINASRQDPQCVNRGLFLAYTHMELVSWLAKNNYTVLATSIKWYSWKKIFAKYRVPLLSVSSQTSDLQSLLKNIQRTAELVHADLEANNVSSHVPDSCAYGPTLKQIPIPPESIKYPKVPVGEPVGPPPEGTYRVFR